LVQAAKRKCWYELLPVIILGVFLLAGMLSLLSPGVAYAAGSSITISGPGLKNPDPITITQEQLQGTEALPEELQTVAGAVYLPQYDEVYSTINTWPTKWWSRGQGVKLSDLLKLAGGLNENATQIRFVSGDGFKVDFTVEDIMDAPRYRFPNFMDTGIPGYLRGDSSDPELVETMIAHHSYTAHDLADVENNENLNDKDANHLLFGQRAVTQQTNSRFAMYVKAIEVLTDPVPKWDNPTASLTPGVVKIGDLVKLSGPRNDEDKVHYTLDGTDPTIDSPMYNWIAYRWWKDRSDELDQINHPIEIKDNTIIKAITIGPGRLDSDVVTFEYLATLTLIKDNPAPAIRNQEYSHTFRAVCGVEPYSFSITNGSLPEGLTLNQETATVEGTPTESGTYTFTLTVRDSADPPKEASREFTLVVVEAPPTLVADTTDNVVGQPIELSFTDDQTWREAITDIKVNDTSIAGQYTVESGKITIDATVFSTAGSYAIAVIATGYLDAIVTQQVTSPGSGHQPGDDEDIMLTITGDGVANPREYSKSQLEAMPQEQHVYSSVNTWPTKSWYVGRGVSLQHLLNEAGIMGNAQQIKFYSRDGYYQTLTVQQLLHDRRYRYPGIMSGGQEGYIPGSSSGATEVPTIVGLKAVNSDNPDYMSETETPLLMIGQRAVTEQTGPQFVKYLNRIEVLTTPPDRWEAPQAKPVAGTVPAGTLVELSSTYNDQDKVHYTLDGSTPTLDSPMYNWVASRWWSSRGDETVAEINCPIELTKDTTIKAITLGPGRMNSEVVEFTYKVTGTAANIGDQIKPSEGGKVSLGDEAVIEIPPGALQDANAVVVKIARVSEPPAASSGFRILGSVYEFTVGDKNSYSFNKPVTIQFTFDPDKVGPGETPAVYYYDQTQEKWVSLGGEISGKTITVQVDHFTMFAVMVETKMEDEDEGEPLNLTDIAGHWGENSIKQLVSLGAIGGYPDGTFKPENNVTRAEFATILVKAFRLDSREGKAFADTRGHWAEDNISTAAYHGIINGYDAARFGPDDSITREQIAVMTVKAAKLTPATASDSFKDSDSISEWAREAVSTTVENEIVKGYPDKTFRPQGNATRAEAVTVIVNGLNKHKYPV
jgi:PKD repeat protein